MGNQPVANFSGTPTIGAPTLTVTFTDSSTNSPTAWSWTFGDSNTSTAQNPSHSYTAVGTYTVALTATNAYGNNTNTKNNYITVGNKPVANFSGTPTFGAVPLAVTFTDSSTYSPTAWSWTFGDSNSSTVQNPSHTYNSAGTYTVALTATNQYGNNTNTKSNYITAGNAPVANFSGTPTIGAPTLSVTFTDSSTNTPTAWSWTFGDSNSSTAQNPSHSYTSVGNYTVALTATNAYGNNTNTKNNYITVGNKPVANFSGTPTSGAAPLAVTFTDSSTYSPDRVVVDLRRFELLHRPEPEPHLQLGRYLHGGPHGDQPVRQQYEHQEQLHHRGQRAGGQLLRHADERHGAPRGDLHRQFDQQPDRVVVDLR